MKKWNNLLIRNILLLILIILLLTTLPIFVNAEEVNPVLVAQTKGSVLGTYNLRNIIRTSTGRLYYFLGNKNVQATGWLEVFTSANGDAWGNTGTTKEWLDTADISAAIDSKNVIHIIYV